MRSLVRSRETLVMLGLCSELLYLAYFVRQFPFLAYYGGNRTFGSFVTSDGAFAGMVVALGALFILFLLAWRQARERPDRGTLGLILGFGAVFQGTLAFVYPLTAVDIYKYAAAGKILLHYHRNPMLTPPQTFPHDPLMQLTGALQHTGAPYGPLGILIDSLPTVVAGENLLLNLLLLKLLAGAVALVDAYLVYRLARRLDQRWAVDAALLVAWNPLVLFQTGINGHNDGAMMLLALLGLLSLGTERRVLGIVLLTASSLVKYGTLLLLPLGLAYGVTRCGSRRRAATFLLAALGASLLLAAALYAPFWSGLGTFRRSLQEDQMQLYSFSRSAELLLPNLGNQATLLGRLLFVALYAPLIWLARRRLSHVTGGGGIALLAFLALAVNNFRPWYALWPVILLAALDGRHSAPGVLLLSAGAAVGGVVFAYGYGVGSLGAWGQPAVLAYAITFLPAAVWMLGVSLRHRVPAWRPNPRLAHNQPNG